MNIYEPIIVGTFTPAAPAALKTPTKPHTEIQRSKTGRLTYKGIRNEREVRLFRPDDLEKPETVFTNHAECRRFFEKVGTLLGKTTLDEHMESGLPLEGWIVKGDKPNRERATEVVITSPIKPTKPVRLVNYPPADVIAELHLAKQKKDAGLPHLDIAALADYLNKKKYTTKLGQKWEAASVRNIWNSQE